MARLPLTGGFDGKLTVNTGPFQFTDVQFDIVDATGASTLSFDHPEIELPAALDRRRDRAVAAGKLGRPAPGSSDGYEVVAVPYPAIHGTALVVAESLGSDQTILQDAEPGAAPDQRGRRPRRRRRRHGRRARRPAAGAPADQGDRAGRGNR